MRYEPKPYQKKGIAILTDAYKRGRNQALFIDMGLGKTSITLTWLTSIDYQKEKILVIAPLAVAKNTWSDEIKKWDHTSCIQYTQILGTKKQREKAIENDTSNFHIINLENLPWLLSTYPFDYTILIIDELSAFKHSNTIRFKMLKQVSARPKFVIGLTGTPAPNGYGDIWSQMFLLDGGKRLGKYKTQYHRDYFEPGFINRKGIVCSWKLRSDREKTIIDEKLKDIALSMMKEDFLELPDYVDNIIDIELTEKAKEIYANIKNEYMHRINDNIVVKAVMQDTSNKLRQICCGHIYDNNGVSTHIHDEKLNALDRIVSEANGEQILVFYSYVADKELILKKFKCDTTDTPNYLARWNAKKSEILLAHPQSIGHGLNLQQGGHIIVWYGLTYSSELYQQSNARLHRTGQSKPVIIHHLLTKNSIEKHVYNALKKKISVEKMLVEYLSWKGNMECK